MTIRRTLQLILTMLVMIALDVSGDKTFYYLTNKELEELGNLTNTDLLGITGRTS